eukprot:4787442-Pleurochrysis_carterae.AAC.3
MATSQACSARPPARRRCLSMHQRQQPQTCASPRSGARGYQRSPQPPRRRQTFAAPRKRRWYEKRTRQSWRQSCSRLCSGASCAARSHEGRTGCFLHDPCGLRSAAPCSRSRRVRPNRRRSDAAAQAWSRTSPASGPKSVPPSPNNAQPRGQALNLESASWLCHPSEAAGSDHQSRPSLTIGRMSEKPASGSGSAAKLSFCLSARTDFSASSEVEM